MKFVIFALVAVVCFAQSSEGGFALNNPNNRIECFFNREKSELKCIAADKFGKNKNESYVQFAIAESNYENNWMILPRKLDNSAYLLNTLTMNGVSKPLSIWHSKKLDHYGLRIENIECFNKLVNIEILKILFLFFSNIFNLSE